ncbi:MAG: hypothetical protein NC078_07925 [Ruminococcus sp.]|nr:hypothetical protein [Ruminococcus sp.]
MRIDIYQYGSPLCSFGENLVSEIMRADSSPGQQEEYNRVMGILSGFSRKYFPDTEDGTLSLDLGKILGDGEITADKTIALPIVLSAVRRQGAALRLLPEIARTMTVYTNTHTAVLEIHYRSLVNLKNLCEAVCEALSMLSGDFPNPDGAAGIIARSLPKERLSLDNKTDISLLKSAVEGIRAVAEQSCGDDSDSLFEFIDDVKPLLEKLEEEN